MARAKLNPTTEQRNAVRRLSAGGFRHEQICIVLGLRSPKTLRKYFREELTIGRVQAAVVVFKQDFDLATDGKHPQHTIHWLRTRGEWSPNMVFEAASEKQAPMYIWYLRDSKAPPYTPEELDGYEDKTPELDDPFEAPPEPEPPRKLV